MSRPNNIGKLLREALLGSPQGLTLRQISAMLEKPSDTVAAAIYRTYGCYLSKWIPNETGFKGYVAVWSCVATPRNAERPPAAVNDIYTDRREYDDQNESAFKKRRQEAKELQRKAREVNAKMKALYEAEKLAAKEQRAAVKAEQERIKAEEKAEAARKRAMKKMPSMQPAAPAGYKPAKTVWVKPPPWSH